MSLQAYWIGISFEDITIVVGVIVVEILHTFFSTHTAHTVLAEGFGDPSVLLTSPFSGAALPAPNGTGTCVDSLL